MNTRLLRPLSAALLLIVGMNTTMANPIVWDPRIFHVTIKFDANGGTLEKNEITIHERCHNKIGPLPVPKRLGYWFGGWHTKADGGELIKGSNQLSSLEACYMLDALAVSQPYSGKHNDWNKKRLWRDGERITCVLYAHWLDHEPEEKDVYDDEIGWKRRVRLSRLRAKHIKTEKWLENEKKHDHPIGME